MIFEMSLFEFEPLVQPMLIMASSDNFVVSKKFRCGHHAIHAASHPRCYL